MIWHALLHIPAGLWKRLKGSQADTTPQNEVNLTAFMGRWYEQARFENTFEHGLDDVYSDYYSIGDERFRVINNGTDARGKPHRAQGMGSRTTNSQQGALQVSFVPPFCWFAAPFHILYTDADYREALIAGSGGHYLWLLTREQHPAPPRIRQLMEEARKRGFDTSALRRTTHRPQNRQSIPTDT
ncbi:MAG: lipocalin family protein [Akkermansia sp.]|nr:lipocalin family protein [Akkermansia sp.]